jgi:hypothetical protein
MAPRRRVAQFGYHVPLAALKRPHALRPPIGNGSRTAISSASREIVVLLTGLLVGGTD